MLMKNGAAITKFILVNLLVVVRTSNQVLTGENSPCVFFRLFLGCGEGGKVRVPKSDFFSNKRGPILMKNGAATTKFILVNLLVVVRPSNQVLTGENYPCVFFRLFLGCGE